MISLNKQPDGDRNSFTDEFRHNFTSNKAIKQQCSSFLDDKTTLENISISTTQPIIIIIIIASHHQKTDLSSPLRLCGLFSPIQPNRRQKFSTYRRPGMDRLLQTTEHSFWQEPLVRWTQPDFLQHLLLTLVTGSMHRQ